MTDGIALDLDHVAITSPEELEDEVVAWYVNVFGLERFEKPEGTRTKGAWLRIGGREIHIQMDEHNPPKVAHFAIVVSDFDEAVERLRKANCHVEQAAPIPGRRRFYTRDPAGNRVEIVQLTESVPDA